MGRKGLLNRYFTLFDYKTPFFVNLYSGDPHFPEFFVFVTAPFVINTNYDGNVEEDNKLKTFRNICSK